MDRRTFMSMMVAGAASPLLPRAAHGQPIFNGLDAGKIDRRR
jgi:hypothetical protein